MLFVLVATGSQQHPWDRCRKCASEENPADAVGAVHIFTGRSNVCWIKRERETELESGSAILTDRS